jgi:aspartate/methionine/tyrosine aminotransferase
LALDCGDKLTVQAPEPSTNCERIMATDLSERQSSGRLPRSPARRSSIDPFIVMDVMREANERAAGGEDIIHMEVGQPATPAPRAARERARAALETDRLGYTDALGLPALRERIAAYYRERYDVGVTPERVVVTAGSSAGFVLAFLAVLDAGDTLLLPSPGYPCYRHILKALGAKPVLIETSPAGRWMPDVRDLDRFVGGEPAGLLVASPNNPTGTMAVGSRLGELADGCRRRDLWLISDEIYHGLEYEEPASTALQHWEAAIVVNSFSKYFSMTGWRIGWLVVPEELVRPLERLAQNLYISPPAISQVAALGAFDGIEELEAIKAGYAANRALLLNELPAAGLASILPADGAFYLYADVSALTADSAAFAKTMLEEIGVAVTPGIDFDPARGRHFIRFSYAGAHAAMREAAARIKTWLRP